MKYSTLGYNSSCSLFFRVFFPPPLFFWHKGIFVFRRRAAYDSVTKPLPYLSFSVKFYELFSTANGLGSPFTAKNGLVLLHILPIIVA